MAVTLQAAEIDRLRSSGATLGILAGVPIAIKVRTRLPAWREHYSLLFSKFNEVKFALKP